MTTEENKHRENAETLLAHAEEMVEKADHLQASEKIWGSVAHTLKEIAEKHGWKNDGHADLGRIAGYLTALSGDKEIDKGFNSASAFHRNFYEDEFELDRIKEGAQEVEETIERLRKAGAQYDEGTLPSNGAPNPTDYYALLRRDTINTDTSSMRRQGLTNYDAATAARLTDMARRRGSVESLSVTFKENKRRGPLGEDGLPRRRRIVINPLELEAQQPRRQNGYWPRRK